MALLEKAEYLSPVPDVNGFIVDFLRPMLSRSGTMHHAYYDRQERVEWKCTSLLEAAARYRFRIPTDFRNLVKPGRTMHSLGANADVLDSLQRDIQTAVARKDDKAAILAATRIQRWGGTEELKKGTGNVAEIESLGHGGRQFCEYLELCQRSFGNGHSLDLAPFVSSKYEARSNAGFTKIYSLLFDDFVIYDSRVAAALGMLVVRYCNCATVPESLRFVYMLGDSAARRDPNLVRTRPLMFPKMAYNKKGSERHLHSNVRANWILSTAVRGTDFEKAVLAERHTYPVTPLRALEAALFMIGYDLAGNDPYPPAVPPKPRKAAKTKRP